MGNSKRQFRLYESVIPEEWQRHVSIMKVVADSKVYSKGVAEYEERIKIGEDVGSLIVIKHPKEDLYAVLDGHHRYHAYSNLGIKKAKCAVIPDPIGLLFTLTKDGMLQPTEEFTEYVRIPFKKLETFLYEFMNHPEGLLKRSMHQFKEKA